MGTMYRYQLPVEQTGWTLQGENSRQAPPRPPSP